MNSNSTRKNVSSLMWSAQSVAGAASAEDCLCTKSKSVPVVPTDVPIAAIKCHTKKCAPVIGPIAETTLNQ